MSLVVYNFESQEVRTVEIEDKTWFVARDICQVLEMTNVAMAVEPLEKDEKMISKLFISSKMRDVTLVSESGVYKILMRSYKPKAVTFQNWLSRDVIPSIRKTGHYGDISQISKIDLARMIIESETRRLELEAKAALDAPKVKSYDELMSSEGLYSMSQVAKLIGKLGRNKTFALLREKGILMSNNEPYQKHIDNGHFAVKTYALNGKKYVQTFATSKGLDFMRALINGN